MTPDHSTATAHATTIDRSPTRVSRWVAIGVAVLTLGTIGLFSWYALGVGTLGVGLVVAGVVRGSRSAVTAGAVCLLAGALVSGVQGAPVAVVLSGVVATVVAWDAGCTAISLGAHLGRDADTVRVEVVHVAGSVAVGLATIVAGYLIYDVSAGGQPVSAVALLVVAAALLVAAVHSSGR